MAEQTLVDESTTAGPEPPRGGRWRTTAILLATMAGLAAVTFLVVVLAPSAGAAGGCGGG
jgi:hypothetical protein